MSTLTQVPHLSLHPTALNDWLPKLGDKAFLAWLQLQSWKIEHTSPDHPHLLRLSLNKIIKKLQVGKTTFYEKIIPPLLRYGFIQIRTSPEDEREHHLLIFASPQNHPEKATLPLHEPAETDPLPQENGIRPDPEPISIHNKDQSSTEKTTPIRSESRPVPIIKERSSLYKMKEKEDKRDIDKNLINQIHPLPEKVKKEIHANPMLLERISPITTVYTQCKDHPLYSDDHFLDKLNHCIKYSHDPLRFATYLHKAILNEWNNRPAPSQPKKGAKDVPEWIRNQHNLPPEEPDELTPEQKPKQSNYSKH